MVIGNTPCDFCRATKARRVRNGRTHTFCSKQCWKSYIANPPINGELLCRACPRLLPITEFSRRFDPASRRGYVSKCKKCRSLATLKRRPWRLHKGDHCEECGFIPVHPCQLDVDHKDCNKTNNEPSNFQTLYANCHRLKTLLKGDWRHAREDM